MVGEDSELFFLWPRWFATISRIAATEQNNAPWLNRKIEQRMKARHAKRTDLVFPATMGGVDAHLLRILKHVAKRAGLTDIRVDDHKFRSTAVTSWLREGVSPQRQEQADDDLGEVARGRASGRSASLQQRNGIDLGRLG